MRPNTRPDDDSSSSPRVIAATGARPANMTAQEYDTATQRYHRGIGVRLPGAHADNWDWQLRARCRDLPVDHFYPRFGLRGHERRKVEANAKAICHGCPVRIDCRTHALRVREPYGVWGGLTAHERAVATRGENP